MVAVFHFLLMLRLQLVLNVVVYDREVMIPLLTMWMVVRTGKEPPVPGFTSCHRLPGKYVCQSQEVNGSSE